MLKAKLPFDLLVVMNEVRWEHAMKQNGVSLASTETVQLPEAKNLDELHNFIRWAYETL